jgi:saccharopine dehydrogenase-like NADP-dependent oxidoreductase
VPFVIADADDESSLAKLAADTDVIIATAGPFAKYGSKVVAAAVAQGTHYCDITGAQQQRRSSAVPHLSRACLAVVLLYLANRQQQRLYSGAGYTLLQHHRCAAAAQLRV